MNRIYFCIDLKTFFASVECVERGLDPFKTDLIVADSDRGKGAICLAISPSMKNKGIRNRCRVFEIPKSVIPIVAKPRMKKYIEYASVIYSVYLKLYNKSYIELAKMIMDDIYATTGITSACGIGTNMYLAKIALDITAKHSSNNIGYLDEEKYIKELSHHLPFN